MSEPSTLTFPISIFVNGKLAAQTTRGDVDYFVEAYRKRFPEAIVEAFTQLQLAKAKKRQVQEGEEVAE